MKKLVIFDLDGTLLNTLDDLADSTNHLLKKYGFPPHPLSAYCYFVGNGIPKLVERALPVEHRDTVTMQNFLQEFVAYYDIHKEDKTSPYEGIVPLLEELQRLGIKMAVASNKIHHAVAPLLHHYFPTIQFAASFGQREGIPTKPHPQIIFDILQYTGVDSKDALYVGDTNVDIQTSAAAGVENAGALWGYRTKEELEKACANHLIDSPADLIKLL